ncbi:MAG: putative sporulation protein YtxC [Firmicutes bacterium]|nr:putative sporulation protein YtxC [Bacillota bacterium]
MQTKICIDSNKSVYLDYIKNYLENNTRKLLVKKSETNGRTCLLVYGSDKTNAVLLKLIKEAIADVCCTFYKYNFLSSKLNLQAKSSLEKATFLKALICFDRDGDIEEINKLLKVTEKDTLQLDAFINFKLKELKNRWLDIIQLTNENIRYLSCPDTFTELLKYLINTNKAKHDEVHIVQKEDRVFVCDSKLNSLTEGQTISGYVLGEINNYYCNGERKDALKISDFEGNVIMSLINLSPKKIVIHENALVSNREYKMIKNLFLDRIYFSKKI